MGDEGLLQQATGLREEARRLLFDEGLLSLISAVGPAMVVGSYVFELMAWRDVDIHVQLPHEKDVATFFDLGKAVATRFEVTQMSYSNQFIRPDQPEEYGLYWGIRILFGGGIWKVDLWGFGEQAYGQAADSVEALRERLAAADRLAVLRIKDGVCQRPEYRKETRAVDIYRAVMEGGVRTVEEFDEWRMLRMGADLKPNTDGRRQG
jgi:hypothetical protein